MSDSLKRPFAFFKVALLATVLGFAAALVFGCTGCNGVVVDYSSTVVKNEPAPTPEPTPEPTIACDRCMDYCMAENGGSYCGTFCNEACRWYENGCVPQCDGAMCGGGDGCGGVCRPSPWHDDDWYGCVKDPGECRDHPKHHRHPCDKGHHRGDKHCDDD